MWQRHADTVEIVQTLSGAQEMDKKQKLDLHLGRWVLRIEANRSGTYFTTTL
jgi:phage terminase large subunit